MVKTPKTALILILIATGLLNATTFYVDPQNGDPANDGSAQRPWKTIQQVFEQKLIQTRDTAGNLRNPDAPVKGGDTILLRSGYHGEIYCRNAANDDYITIAADKNHTPRVKRVFFSAAKKWNVRGLTVSPSFAAAHEQHRLIQIVNWGGASEDFIVENNTLFSAPDASSWTAEQWNKKMCYGINVIADNVKIKNNKLTYVNHGISVTGNDITVERNHIEHIAGDGIVCSADNASLLYNTIKHFYKVNANHDDGIQFHRGRDKTTPVKNARIIGNKVIAWDNTVKNPLLTSPQGICNFDIPAINWRIENNLVLVRHHHGITINGCRGGIITNNIAINPYGGRFFAGISLGTTHGKTTSKNSLIRNNIVDSKIGYPDDNTADHNIIADDLHRYFRNPEKLDMHHKTKSPAIDAGSNDSAPAEDIEGTKRPQGKSTDPGPYEHKQKMSFEMTSTAS